MSEPNPELIENLLDEFVERLAPRRVAFDRRLRSGPSRVRRADPRTLPGRPGHGADCPAPPAQPRTGRLTAGTCPSSSATSASSARSAAAAWELSTRPSRSRCPGTSRSRCCPHPPAQSRVAATVPARSPHRGPTAPYEYRARLRRRGGSRFSLHRDAVDPGRGAGQDPRATRPGLPRQLHPAPPARNNRPGPALAPRHDRRHRQPGAGEVAAVAQVSVRPGVLAERRPDRGPGRRRPALRPPARHAPPRHQAGQPAGRSARHRLDHRLRPGQSDGARRGEPDGRHRRHLALHGAGAVPRRSRRPQRHLQPRPDLV